MVVSLIGILLKAAVHWTQPISLRRIAQQLWPSLPWRPMRPGDVSAAETIYEWPGSLPLTPAIWLAEQLRLLERTGVLQAGPSDRTEVDDLAALTWHAGFQEKI